MLTDRPGLATDHSTTCRQARSSTQRTSGTTRLDPLRQVRLVTLAFEAMGEADQRKTARTAAVDLVKGEQGAKDERSTRPTI